MKPEYSSYKCGHRKHEKCADWEIERHSLENIVLDLLYQHFFTPAAIKNIVVQINAYQQQLEDTQSKMNNIAEAIANGIFQSVMKKKMEELERQKHELELEMESCEKNTETVGITEEQIRSILLQFQNYVKSKNIPECKRFINQYIKRVTVYEEHMEITFLAAFTLKKKQTPTVTFEREIKKENIPSKKKQIRSKEKALLINNDLVAPV